MCSGAGRRCRLSHLLTEPAGSLPRTLERFDGLGRPPSVVESLDEDCALLSSLLSLLEEEEEEEVSRRREDMRPRADTRWFLYLTGAGEYPDDDDDTEEDDCESSEVDESEEEEEEDAEEAGGSDWEVDDNKLIKVPGATRGLLMSRGLVVLVASMWAARGAGWWGLWKVCTMTRSSSSSSSSSGLCFCCRCCCSATGAYVIVISILAFSSSSWTAAAAAASAASSAAAAAAASAAFLFRPNKSA